MLKLQVRSVQEVTAQLLRVFLRIHCTSAALGISLALDISL